MTFTDIAPASAEIFMAIAALVLLVAGVVRGDRSLRLLTWAVVGVMVLALAAVWCTAAPDAQIIFNGLFVADRFALFTKTILLLGAILALLMGGAYAERHMQRFEYPILILLTTLGTLLMVSANDMLSLYVGLELQSLALYILAAFRRDDLKSSEAGLKYFVLGALSSGILLFGISLLYGITGTTNFDQLHNAATLGSPVVLVGIVFVLAGLAFKISAVPFHMWVPDVYEGAPTAVTAFFAAVPKVAAFALLLRVMFVPFETLFNAWQMLAVIMAVASMLIGAFAALKQTNIKRLMAYSSIGHVGYALVGVAAGGQEGISSVLLYLAIYYLMTIGTFAVILVMRRDGKQVENLEDLAGLGKSHPVLALAMAALMFSMAGVPPLAGFFGKFYVFMAALNAGLVVLAVLGVLLSAVSAYYYMRIIKIMYFDDATSGALDRVPELQVRFVLGISAAFIVLFTFMPSPLIDAAGRAAQSLLS
ncbi:MAG: NADH-quinone oxidoreductase subunit NuoN [Bdellovibrionales bacterium]